MSIMAVEDRNQPVGEFAEGTVLLGVGKWFCVTHEVSVKVGQPCMFCLHDEVGPVEFDRILNRKRKH